MRANCWQFSTRHLLVLTAIVSVILAVAVRMPAFFRVVLAFAAPVLIVVAILQSANLATSDRRPRLAVVAWLALGSFFAFYCYAILHIAWQNERVGSLIPFAIMAACCATCIAQAWRSFQLIGKPPADADSIDARASGSMSGDAINE
jgi:hypothetical protein